MSEIETKHYGHVNDRVRAEHWGRSKDPAQLKYLDKKFGKGRPLMPICPYGCDREGTLLEIVMGDDGQAVGIFNDYPCNCIFTADIQVGDPPKTRKNKLVMNADGEMVEVEDTT